MGLYTPEPPLLPTPSTNPPPLLRVYTPRPPRFDAPRPHLNVKNAFLNGDIVETVYMHQLPDFDTTGKSLIVSDAEFTLSSADYSLFTVIVQQMILLVYIDEILITGDDSKDIHMIKEHLVSVFQTKDLENLRHFLGIEVTRRPDGLVLSQRKYYLDLLHDADYSGCKTADTLMNVNYKLCVCSSNFDTLLPNSKYYHYFVGKLIYLTVTRPDISFDVMVVSRFMLTPRISHLHAVERILRYPKSDPGQGLVYKPSSSPSLIAYSDTDYAESQNDCRSTSGAYTSEFNNRSSETHQTHKVMQHEVAGGCSSLALAGGSLKNLWRIAHIPLLGASGMKPTELSDESRSGEQAQRDPRDGDARAASRGRRCVMLWKAWTGYCKQFLLLSLRNRSISYEFKGLCIDVGSEEDELTILDVRKFKPIHRRKFNYEVNEIAWNTTGELFFLTTGNGTVEVLGYPSLKILHTLMAHTAGCYCIAIDPIGRALVPELYFAVGSADSLVGLWDVSEMLCVRTFTKLEWPVRTISFNHTGEFIASASEDPFIDISNVQTGRSVHQIPCKAAMNSVEWNPKQNLLAYAGDDKNKYQTDEGVFRVFGFEST
ncbi:hypothetical protein KSP40_PGU013082 [Platanthera guangdongensis]|uniref:Uncharacterized protein n=1 Tax=Platanthera guangdongensis TaxID=2320717 RepID=A0ABR2MH48_9ASPA